MGIQKSLSIHILEVILRSMHICPFRTCMVWLGTCAFWRADRIRKYNWKLLSVQILGFIEVGDNQEAVIQCSEKPLEWKTVETKFFVAITIGTDYDISFVMVPIDALVHPLCVLPDIGGNANSYFAILPRRNWSRYFDDKIRYNKM